MQQADHRADYFEEGEERRVKCLLCPQQCVLSPGRYGVCRGRVNREGVLYTENYARVSSLGVDPIEKKPLYHFYPGSRVLSLGTFGCNFHCQFCQNWEISQSRPMTRKLEPEIVVRTAREEKTLGIAFTYSEPAVWFEYIRDTGRLSREEGLKNILVTNGYINQEPLQELLPLLDAVNVDLKSFRDDFYRKYCGGSLEPVLNNIRLLAADRDTHLEVTTLIVTGLNDSEEELEELFSWLGEVDPDIPLHLSRYFPRYKMKKTATPVETMEAAHELAGRYINHVYLGNLFSEKGSNTYCPDCGELLVLREGYRVKNRLEGSNCPDCGRVISGFFRS